MDISKIKNLIKSSGDKFIVLDNAGNPELVIISFAEYEKLAHKTTGNIDEVRISQAMIGEKHEESVGAGDFEPLSFQGSVGLPVRLEDIRLEDLPI